MSELEFQRELTPDQMHEALSLLDGTARAKNRNLQVEDLGAPTGIILELIMPARLGLCRIVFLRQKTPSSVRRLYS
jgi:hypothetical protein